MSSPAAQIEIWLTNRSGDERREEWVQRRIHTLLGIPEKLPLSSSISPCRRRCWNQSGIRETCVNGSGERCAHGDGTAAGGNSRLHQRPWRPWTRQFVQDDVLAKRIRGSIQLQLGIESTEASELRTE